MRKNYLYYLCVLLFILSFNIVFAEVDPSAVISRRAELEAQLKQYETQIEEYQNLISQKQQEAQSLKRDIDVLSAQVAKTKLEIKARELTINKLIGEIGQKSDTIDQLSKKIDYTRKTLADFLRQVSEHDSLSAIELALVYRDLSEFFSELESLTGIQDSIHKLMTEVTQLRKEEIEARDDLEQKRSEEVQLKSLQDIAKKDLEGQEKQKQTILKDTRGKESEYKKILGDKKKLATSIRTQLFLLQGSSSIPFEKALEYANFASRVSGVRAAFILGIIAQESELGRNVGQCNLPGGDSSSQWRAVMKPERDYSAFLTITSELGLDPNRMPVSCPLRNSNGKRVGWGGAMGPAQFIPSTWLLYKERIASATNHNLPNPWDPKDAFTASGIYLGDLGAVSGNRTAEKTAAAKYFAGSNWNSYLGRSYASQVLGKVDKYQEQIDLLQSFAQR